MNTFKSKKHTVWINLVTSILVIAFFCQNLVFANGKLDRNYLAAQSRLTSFFERHGLDTGDIGKIIMSVGGLKEVINGSNQGAIEEKIANLNQFLSDRKIKIEGISEYTLRCSQRKIKYAVFNFEKSGVMIKAMFVDRAQKLTPAELEELGIKDEEKHHLDCPGLENVWFVKIPFKEYKIEIDSYRHFHSSTLILKEIKKVILENGYDLRGHLDPDKNYWSSYSDEWRSMLEVLQHIVKNLAQHEYEPYANLIMRIYISKEPYDGVRVEFWGPGKVPLPQLLKKKPWFTHVDRPWNTDYAPKEARSVATTRCGHAIGTYLFELFRQMEQGWKLPSDQHVLIGWREDTQNEGPRSGGHIISLHIPVRKAELVFVDKPIGGGMNNEQLRKFARTHSVEDLVGYIKLTGLIYQIKIIRDALKDDPTKLAEFNRLIGKRKKRPNPLSTTKDNPPVPISTENFVEQYQGTTDPDALLALLLNYYQMDGVKIKVHVIRGILGMRGVGRTRRISPKSYEIELVGVEGHYLQYLLFHEFLHIYLEEKGLTFNWKSFDGGINSYLFNLRNFVNDYLIEKENQRVFGNSYVGITQDTRDTDVRGQFEGLGSEDNVRIFILALTCKAITTLYSELSNSFSAKLISSECISVRDLDKIIKSLQSLSIASTFEDYSRGISRIHFLLTGDASRFRGNTIVIEEGTVLEICRQIDGLVSQIKTALAGRRSPKSRSNRLDLGEARQVRASA